MLYSIQSFLFRLCSNTYQEFRIRLFWDYQQVGHQLHNVHDKLLNARSGRVLMKTIYGIQRNHASVKWYFLLLHPRT